MPSRMLILLLLFTSFNVTAASMEDTKESSQASAPTDAAPINENANDKATCAAKWDRYHKSQECFAPYLNTNGSLKPGAFENCTEIKYPTECDLPGSSPNN